MRKKCSVLLVLLLALSLFCGLSVSAAGDCPDMPKGADNLFKPETMEMLGDGLLVFYENETLLCDSRSADMTYGKMSVSFDFNAKMNKEYVISFWGKSNNDANKYLLRLLDDGEGNYCEIEFNASSAQVFASMGGIDRYSLPSNGKCMAASGETLMGEWKNVCIRVKPGSSATEISLYIDGEQMKTSAGATSSKVDSTDRVLMFGTTAPLMMRGIRVYEVDSKAKEFEAPFDPDAEFTDAEDGTDGDNGGTGVKRITTTAAAGSAGTTGEGGTGGQSGESADLGLILGIAGGAVAVVAIVAVVLLVVMKKKKNTEIPDAQPAEKEDEDK